VRQWSITLFSALALVVAGSAAPGTRTHAADEADASCCCSSVEACGCCSVQATHTSQDDHSTEACGCRAPLGPVTPAEGRVQVQLQSGVVAYHTTTAIGMGRADLANLHSGLPPPAASKIYILNCAFLC
jgi:hypothetical protein